MLARNSVPGEIPELLKRTLGLWDVVAIGLNGVIGTGIFLVPGYVTAMMGPASLVNYLISALLCTAVVLCFAEVGSRFRGTGYEFESHYKYEVGEDLRKVDWNVSAPKGSASKGSASKGSASPGAWTPWTASSSRPRAT